MNFHIYSENIKKENLHTNSVDWIHSVVPVSDIVLTWLSKTDNINQSKLELIDWHGTIVS